MRIILLTPAIVLAGMFMASFCGMFLAAGIWVIVHVAALTIGMEGELSGVILRFGGDGKTFAGLWGLAAGSILLAGLVACKDEYEIYVQSRDLHDVVRQL